MNPKEILHLFEETDALRQGHFQLTSGLHSSSYFQCAMVLQHPEHLERFCREIVQFYEHDRDIITAVIAPAVGGIVVSQEVGRQFGVRSIFAERVDGKMTLRRGFHLERADNVLIVEDVITTGGSVREVIQLAEECEANIIGIGCVVDRNENRDIDGMPLFSVYSTKMIAYQPDECPLCKDKKPLHAPGSRYIKK